MTEPPEEGGGPERTHASEPHQVRTQLNGHDDSTALTVRKEDDEQHSRMLRRLRDGWAKVEASARNTLTSTIDFGRELLAAQEMFGRGTFCRLFESHKNPLPDALPCSYELARRAMRIAEHPVLANHKHACVLPRDVDAVFILSRLADDRLEHEIEGGTIRPTMTRKEARALVQEARPEKRADEPRKLVSANEARTLAREVIGACPVCSKEADDLAPEQPPRWGGPDEDSKRMYRLVRAWEDATKCHRLRFLKLITRTLWRK